MDTTISAHDFFRENQPTFSPETVEQFATWYLSHFRSWKTNDLHTWVHTQLQKFGIAKEVSAETVHSLIDKARKDVEQALSTDPALGADGRKVVIGHYPGFTAITMQRLAHLLHERNIPELPRALTEWAHSKTWIDIHPGAQIGEYFFMDHGTGIVIGETVVIGDRVVLYHGVTLGNRSEPKPAQAGKRRHPTLGNDVRVFAGATVIGNITLGDSAKIGSGAFVTKNIEAGAKVMR